MFFYLVRFEQQRNKLAAGLLVTDACCIGAHLNSLGGAAVLKMRQHPGMDIFTLADINQLTVFVVKIVYAGSGGQLAEYGTIQCRVQPVGRYLVQGWIDRQQTFEKFHGGQGIARSTVPRSYLYTKAVTQVSKACLLYTSRCV